MDYKLGLGSEQKLKERESERDALEELNFQTLLSSESIDFPHDSLFLPPIHTVST